MYAQCAGKSSRMLHFLASQIKPYRAAQATNPSTQIPKFSYSLRTSNSSLRPHIRREHLDLFMSLAKQRGWNVSYVTGQSETSDSVVPPSAEGEQREQFSEELFRKRLLNFIVADDQVCIFAP